MRSILRRPVFNIEFEWTHPRRGITQHGADSPPIPDEWKPKEKSVLTVQEIVDGPSEVLTPPSEAHWFSMELASENHVKYQPLKEQTILHREFSEIPCFPVSPQAIVKFAGKYGLLGIGAVVPTSNGILLVESSYQWETEIHSMWEAIQIWDGLNNANLSDRPESQQVIKKTQQGFWHVSPSLRKAIGANPEFGRMLEEYHRGFEEWGSVFFRDNNYLAGPRYHERFLKDWLPSDDKIGPIKQYLINLVNDHLIGNVVPQFHLEKHGSHSEEIETSIAPRNLLGALWLQFFLEITRHNVKKCLMCKTPFVAQREDQVYCTKNGQGCRKKANRARNEVLRDGRPKIEVAKKYHISTDDLDKILARSSKKQAHS